MPSERRQFSVRMSDDTAEKVDRLLPAVSRIMRVELSQAQFFALAVAALEEKHAAELSRDSSASGSSALAAEESAPKKPKGKK